MIFLGLYSAGETVKYRANFHNDTGTLENPTSPEAQREDPSGTFTVLTAPAIINAKTGHYGGSIDTTGFAAGQHFIRMAGSVTTGKTVAAEFCFEIVAFNPKVATAGGLPIVGTGTNNFKSDASANVTYANAAPPTTAQIATGVWQDSTAGDFTVSNSIGKNLKIADTTPGASGGHFIAGTNAATSITTALTANITGNLSGSVNSVATDVGITQGGADKVWGTTVRTLSAAGVQAIWDALTSALTTAGSIGLGLSRFVNYGFYQNAAVWIDTVGGAAGTVAGVNGTNRNPVNNIADANTLAGALNLKRFMLTPASSVTFAATQTDQEWNGGTIALGGQNIGSSTFKECIISGVGTGTLATYEECTFLATTVGASTRMRRCNFAGNITIGAAGVYIFRDCATAVLGAAIPVIDFGAAIGASTVNLRNYTGGVEVQNMLTGDALFVEGVGDLTVNANCTAGSVTVRGIIGLTNNGSGQTLDLDQRVTNNTIALNLFTYDMSTVTGEATRSFLNSIRKLMNRWAIAGSTLTVYKENDSTVAYTQTVTGSAGADPITAIDTD